MASGMTASPNIISGFLLVVALMAVHVVPASHNQEWCAATKTTDQDDDETSDAAASAAVYGTYSRLTLWRVVSESLSLVLLVLIFFSDDHQSALARLAQAMLLES